MVKVNPVEFGLAWWEITKAELNLSAAEKKSSLIAITINGASAAEAKAIKEWCRTNPVHRFTKLVTWDDSYGDGDHHIRYRNNQMMVLAEPSTIGALTHWLDTLPKRTAAVMIDLDVKEIRKLVRGTVSRIVTDLYDHRRHVVSLADCMLATELVLRSD